MSVSLVNDGPVTIVLDADNSHKPFREAKGLLP